MDSIKTLFLLIFFSQWVLLTPDPLDIGNEWIEITPSETLDVITGGAAIYVDVSHLVKKPLDFDGAKELFPEGSIEGVLITKNAKEIRISSKGNSFTNEETFLVVPGVKLIPTNIEIIAVKLRSSIELKGAKVFWKNGRK